MFLPGESQGWRSLVGCRLWDLTESDTTKETQQQQQQQCNIRFNADKKISIFIQCLSYGEAFIQLCVLNKSLHIFILLTDHLTQSAHLYLLSHLAFYILVILNYLLTRYIAHSPATVPFALLEIIQVLASVQMKPSLLLFS